ncbi:MAG TPA: helix-turn-helix domain-containing protein [Thermomicrobiales bacterium]|nr:helix-turn-helix domain-containing protein [Thermomicrobiales bacterium]
MTAPATPARLLLRVREAARLADVPRSTAYELIARGEWPHVRAEGVGLRVPLAALEEWIARRTRYGYDTNDATWRR